MSLTLALATATVGNSQTSPRGGAIPPPTTRLRAAGLPDLVVENVRQQRGQVLADVRNAGSAPSTATDVTLLVGGRKAATQPLAGIAPGRTITVAFALPQGAQRVQVMADMDGLVAESDEGNNRPPVLVITSVDAPSSSASAGGRPAPQGRPASPVPASGGSVAPVQPKSPVVSSKIATDKIVAPASVANLSVPGSVILRGGSTDQILSKLTVIKQYSATQIQSKPVMTLGSATISFKPILDNPLLPLNVGKTLKASPALADVLSSDLTVYEVPEGLVVRSSVSFQLRPGACADQARRADLGRTGISCSRRTSDAERAAEFADRNSPRYIARPDLRAQATAEAREAAKRSQQQIDGYVGQLRSSLSDPAGRAAIDAKWGKGASLRLSGMSNSQLGDELVNSGVQKVEQFMFIPRSDQIDGETLAASFLIAPGGGGQTGKIYLAPYAKSAPPPSNPQPVKKSLQGTTFLTGFTLGRAYEWRKRVQTTISWCVFGCEETYYAELFATFDYGFGLRFPIALSGQYSYEGKDKASLTVNFAPVDGSASDYAATGLPQPKIFSGKELVAQFSATAGASVYLPLAPPLSVSIPVGKDFTEGLPAPYANGQFKPPSPGSTNAPLVKVFDDFDLIGGRANIGVAGGQVFPAIKAELSSDKLTFKVFDDVRGVETLLEGTGKTIALGVDAKDQSSRFSIGDPVYGLHFLVTPGIDARLFIDIGVWSDHWDWPVWFPQLAVKLPPNDVEFACHSLTTCTRNYVYSPTQQGESLGQSSKFLTDVEKWAKTFETQYLPQCADEICMFAVKLHRANAQAWAKNVYGLYLKASETAQSSEPVFSANPEVFAKAEQGAKIAVQEGQARMTQSASQGYKLLTQAVWSKKCSDVPCLKNVEMLSNQLQAALVKTQSANPDWSSLHVQTVVGPQFGAKFAAEIKASKARAAAAGN
ncbi:MAG: hypothetical protein KF842_10055 [Caulobacter sp.]|nr:hypothetical protein [Caulobacter sp.]